MEKSFKVLLVFLLMLFSVLPAPVAGASMSGEVAAAAWPEVFTPYVKEDGSGIYDPASDVHPIDVDITSGIDKGKGKSPSMYIASDGNNFFVRLRVKGDPYDRKGGFLSSVWLVQLAVNGKAKATIGLNGKSPSNDYIYVADANGKNVKTVYQTTSSGNQVEGTRISAAENGQYFLDFQVPISAITGVASEITAETPVQLFFGTSKAANLSVINKEWMDNGDTDKAVNFTGLKKVTLSKQPLAVEIDGGISKEYSAVNNLVSGKSSVASGTISLKIASNEPVSVPVAGYKWSYQLPAEVTKTNGIYPAVATVNKDVEKATASQDMMVIGNTDTLTIDGGTEVTTKISTPLITGTYKSTTNRQNFSIDVYVSETATALGTLYNAKTDNGTFSVPATLSNAAAGKAYYVTAIWKEQGNNKPTYATAKQIITYQPQTNTLPVKVSISPIEIGGGAYPGIKGTSSGAEQVEVRIDGVSTAFVTPASDGWTMPALEKPLSKGKHTITAIAYNSAGDTAVATEYYNVAAVAITIDNGEKVVTNDNQPTIRGNTNATTGSDVMVTIENSSGASDEPYSGKVENGRWKIEVPIHLRIEDGNYKVTAQVYDATFNQEALATQTLIIDSKTQVAISNPVDGSTSTETKPALTGTAEQAATVELVISDAENNLVLIENLTADAVNGNWMHQVAEELAIGQYQLTATASDPYGNEAAKTHKFSIAAAASTITEVSPAKADVEHGTVLEEAKQALGPTVQVNLDNGKTEMISVIWEEKAGHVYDGTKAGSYEFAGTLTNLPAHVANDLNLSAKGTVTVLAAPTAPTKSIDSAEIETTVEYGTSIADVKKILGNSVLVAAGDVKESVEVVWDADSIPSYVPTAPGTYTFYGTFGDLPESLDNNKGIKPMAKVTVSKVNIESAAAVEKAVAYGTSEEDARKALDSMVPVKLASGEERLISIEWNAVSDPAYDGEQPNKYTFTGSFGQLPADVDNKNNIAAPAGIVTVLAKKAAIIEKIGEVEKTVDYGTSKEAAIAELGETVSVTLNDSTVIDIPVTWKSDSSSEYNGTVAATYTFTGDLQLPEDVIMGENVAAPVGKVTVSPKLTKSIKAVSPIKEAVKKGTDIDSAQAKLGTEVTVELEDGTEKNVPVTWSAESKPAYSEETVGEYAFTGTFGKLPEGIDNENGVTAPVGTIQIMSDAADIISYSFAEETKPATIDKENRTIAIEVKYGTDVSGLKAAFTLSKYAQDLLVGQTSQTSGETVNDFTNPVLYSVIAEDGTTKEWAVTVTIADQEQTDQPKLVSPSPLYAGSQKMMGTSEANAEIIVKRSGVIIGNGKADDSGNWIITFEQVIELFEDDELNITAIADGKLESTAETVKVIGLNFNLTSDPTHLTADGISQSNLKAVLTDSQGNAISGVEVEFDIEDGAGTLSAATAVTNDQGEAVVVLTSPKIIGIEKFGKNITASVENDAKGIFSSTEIEIQFSPPVVVGQVLDGNGTPFEDAKVWIVIDGKEYIGQTDSEGNYSITVPQGGDFMVNILVEQGGTSVVLKQHATVETEGLGEESITDRTVSGKLLMKTGNIQAKSIQEVFPGAELLVNVYNLDGSEAHVDAEIDSEGIYALTDFEPEKTYHVVFNIVMNGQKLAGKLSKIRVGTDGQLIVQNELIDPFGLVTDSSSKKVLDGVSLKIYWADTKLNRDMGREPNALVDLPVMENFPPNQNKNPQFSTKELENTAEIGNYAWMVYAQGDYYIKGEKAGYVTYDSRNDNTTVSKLGDSWIENGIIHIGETMMRYDFAMAVKTTVPTIPVEPAPNVPPTIPVKPAPGVMPKITIDSPIEGQFIIDTAPSFNGTTDANQKVAIYLDGKQIGTAAADKNGKWIFTNPGALAEGKHTVYAVVLDEAGNPVQSKEIRFTFAKTKQHIQYMYGYKDGDFKPELPVTRAQMAAMLSRNLTDNQVPKTSKNSYVDTKTSWAKSDIEYALSQEIMFGYSGKNFRPTDEVTRAQMAAIAVRWIEKQCTENPKYASYCLVQKEGPSYQDVSPSHWAAKEITKISRIGLMNGFENGSFKPEEKLTRAQATRVLNRLFQRGPLEGVAVPSFKDVPKNHWAYKEIEEAAKNHFYVIKDGKEVFKLNSTVSQTQ